MIFSVLAKRRTGGNPQLRESQGFELKVEFEEKKILVTAGHDTIKIWLRAPSIMLNNFMDNGDVYI
jgi:hypothetical protein